MKKLATLLLILFMSIQLHAQKNNHEKIRNARIAYITNELELTASQAEKFWPIYNKHKNEIHAIMKGRNKLQRKIDFTKISEQEAQEIVKKTEEKHNLIHLKKSQFIEELQHVITYKQILKLKISERKFKKNLLEKIKRKH